MSRKVIPIAEEHARLSPSSSYRWLNCSGSANVTAKRKASKAAEMGTAAHELLEMSIRLHVDPEKFLGKKLYKEWEVTEDSCHNVRFVLDYIRSYVARNKGSTYSAERRVDIGLALGRDDVSGTLDVSVDNYPHELVILDYKNGVQSVEVDDNSQVMLYAVGKVVERQRKYKRYRFVIVQPRDRHEEGPVREWTCTHDELVTFTKYVKERAALTDNKDAPRTAGAWCHWCPVEGSCRTLVEYNYRQAGVEFGNVKEPKVKELNNKELGQALTDAPMLEGYLKALRAEGERRMMQAQKIPNWKLVLGRTMRKVMNEKRAIAKLQKLGFEVRDYMVTTLGGIGVLEKLCKENKLDFNKVMKGIVQQTLPHLHVAPASDKRPEYKRGQEFAESE